MEELVRAVEKRSKLYQIQSDHPQFEEEFWLEIAEELFGGEDKDKTRAERAEFCKTMWTTMKNDYSNFVQFLDKSIHNETENYSHGQYLPVALEFLGQTNKLEMIEEDDENEDQNQGGGTCCDGNPSDFDSDSDVDETDEYGYTRSDKKMIDEFFDSVNRPNRNLSDAQ